MKSNNKVEEILEELDFNDKEKRIFMDSIQKTKLAQINDEIDPKALIVEKIKEEFL